MAKANDQIKTFICLDDNIIDNLLMFSDCSILAPGNDYWIYTLFPVQEIEENPILSQWLVNQPANSSALTCMDITGTALSDATIRKAYVAVGISLSQTTTQQLNKLNKLRHHSVSRAFYVNPEWVQTKNPLLHKDIADQRLYFY